MGDLARSRWRVVGRDDVRDRIVAVLADAAPTSGSAVIVEGEAGVGKTSLLHAVVEHRALRDLTVRAGGARELDAELPGSALADVLSLAAADGDPLRERIRDVLRSSGGDEAQRRWQLADGLRQVIERDAARGPMLLVVEDAHWLDRASAVAIGRVAGAFDELPVRLIVTARPEPQPPHVAAMLRQLEQAGAARIALDALPRAVVSELAEELLGGPVGATVEDGLQRAGGNPLYVTELLEAYVSSGAVEQRDGRWELTTSGTPPSLRVAIVRRLGYLPDETIRVLRLAAVLGPTSSPVHLAAVAGLDPLALTTQLEPAYRSGLLEDVHDDVTFRHVVIREALYGDLPTATRDALHRHVAEVLTVLGAPPAQLAGHLAHSLTPGDASTAEALLDTAARLVESAPAAAERHARTAADALPPSHPARLRARAIEAEAAIRTGNAEVAEALVHELDNDALPARQRLELWRTFVLGRDLRGELTPEMVEEYAAAVRAEDAGASITARHLATVASLVPWLDPDRARALLAEIQPGPDLDAETRALMRYAEGASSVVLGDIDAAKRLTGEALEVLRTAGLVVSWAGVVCLSVYTNVRCVFRGEAEEADAILGPVIETAELAGLHFAVPRLRQSAARAGFFWGDHDGAIAHLEAGLEVIEGLGQREIEGSVRAMLARLVALRGRYEDALAHLDASPPTWSEYSSDGVMLQAWVADAQGDAEAAWAHACRSMELLRDRGPRGFMLYLWVLPFAGLARRLGHREELARLADELRHFDELARGDAPPIHANAAVVHALLEPTSSHVDAALGALSGAPTYPCRLEGLRLLAEALIDADSRERAIELLREGRELANACGASAVVARYDALLRDLGVRRRQVGTVRPDDGWEALTEAEWRVVELVVEGLTYKDAAERLFVSRRTVEAHVRSIFRKLDINSRNELTRLELERRAG